MKLTLLRHSLAGLLFAFPLTQPAFSQDKKDDKKPDDKKEEPKPDDKKEDGKPDDKKEDKEKEDEDEKDEIINSEEQAKFPLDSLLTGKAEVWKLTPDEVEKTFKKAGFKWLETGKKERGLLRPRRLLMKKESGKSNSYTVTKTSYTLFTGAESAAEVNFEFKTGALAAVNISVWNKGDSDEIVEVAFKKKIDNVIAGLNTNMAVKGRDMGRDMASAAKAFRYRWENPGTMAQLEYSSTKERQTGFQGEFIRLRLLPKTGSTLGAAKANVAKTNSRELLARVEKNAEGDVYVKDVPMVDQGEKGYCAVASTERVLRYYGVECDQHDIAQAAEASAGGGTSPSNLQDALHGLQGKFSIRVRDLITWEQRDYVRLIRAYNSEAKKAGAKLWNENQIFYSPNVDVLRLARCRNGAYEKFIKMVTDSTSKGLPLLWALRLGDYPENGEPARQSGGGHMRVILGYNAKTDSILFSDSWGAGHELKRMKGQDAYAATFGLYLIEPNSR